MKNSEEFSPDSADVHAISLRMRQFELWLEAHTKKTNELQRTYGMWLGNRGLRQDIDLSDNNAEE